MGFEQKFKEIIRSAVTTGKAVDLAQKAGIPQPTLSMLVTGKREGLQLATVGKLLDALEADIVLPGEPPPEQEDFKRDYLLVPKVKAIAGAGASFVVDGDTTGLYAFRREFLEREHIHTTDLVMMMIQGDSMEPLIREGDTVLVDQTDTSLTDGKIYILRIDDALMCKRVEKIPGGWRVKSDNPERGFYDLRGDELETMHIFGRVRWFGRVV